MFRQTIEIIANRNKILYLKINIEKLEKDYLLPI